MSVRLSRLAAAALGGACALLAGGCPDKAEPPRPQRLVVVYCSVDQDQSEPVLRAFEGLTGIRALPVYDVEASKTTGLVNRLIAEKARPRADVFWSGEYAQTILLKQEGLLAACTPPNAATLPAEYKDAESRWFGLAGRARVFLINTNLVPRADWPASLDDLLNPKWPAGRVAIASPLFGTTLTHAAALYALWGEETAHRFFAALQKRGLRVVPGNADVRELVARGEAQWGLTDTDDAAGAIARGAPVAVVIPDQKTGERGTLVIPGSVAVVAGGPHPEEAAALVNFLLSPKAEQMLVESGWCHVPLRAGAPRPLHVDASRVKALAVEPAEVCAQIQRAREELAALFVK